MIFQKKYVQGIQRTLFVRCSNIFDLFEHLPNNVRNFFGPNFPVRTLFEHFVRFAKTNTNAKTNINCLTLKRILRNLTTLRKYIPNW